MTGQKGDIRMSPFILFYPPNDESLYKDSRALAINELGQATGISYRFDFADAAGQNAWFYNGTDTVVGFGYSFDSARGDILLTAYGTDGIDETFHVSPNVVVPEPSTLALGAFGCVSLVWWRRRRR